MLTDTSELKSLTLRATDGQIGKIKDIYFDDQTWAVQYFVADTGPWLAGRKVLISPQSAEAPDWERTELPVGLTRKQIEDSPPIAEDQPVSRQAQLRLGQHFNWGAYWTVHMGVEPVGLPQAAEEVETVDEAAADAEADPHLRSVEEVRGYKIVATDDEVGHVEDFVLQTDGWALRYMIVDTRNWLPGRKVLVATAWITKVDWLRAQVTVDLERESIRNAPEFEPGESLQRDYEERLHRYYGKMGYWDKLPDPPSQGDRGGEQS